MQKVRQLTACKLSGRYKAQEMMNNRRLIILNEKNNSKANINKNIQPLYFSATIRPVLLQCQMV